MSNILTVQNPYAINAYNNVLSSGAENTRTENTLANNIKFSTMVNDIASGDGTDIAYNNEVRKRSRELAAEFMAPMFSRMMDELDADENIGGFGGVIFDEMALSSMIKSAISNIDTPLSKHLLKALYKENIKH
jgi:hypothetical protein